MTMTLKFQPGSFVELDDLNGGRRVALIGRDGISCIDSMDVSLATPLFLHPVFAPRGLGTLMEFVKENRLHGALMLVSVEPRAGDEPMDVLQLMQRLWCLSRMGLSEDKLPTSDQLADSRVQAAMMRNKAEEIHRYAARYQAPQV